MNYTHRIKAIKRTGELIEGFTHDDGLRDLWAVDTTDGTRYVSSLDQVLELVAL